MFTIVHTDDCLENAKAISSAIGESVLIPVSKALSDPSVLGEFDNLGLVFRNDGPSLPVSMQDFIRDVLSSYDLSGLQYMFSVCESDNGPGHSLKIVEKLCAKVGCAPSLSYVHKSGQSYEEMASLVEKGSIVLAKGSLGTSFYMLTHGIKTRKTR